MLLKDRNAVIYGGGGAIGGAVARVFAREGARIFLGGKTKARLDRVAGEIAAAGGTVEAAEIDMLDLAAVQHHADEAAAKAGGIDIVFNGVSFPHDQGTPLTDLSLETFMFPVDRSLRALFICCKAVEPHMGGQRPGVILAMSAPGARLAIGGHLGHAASAAGCEAFCRVLADELGPRDIRVVTLRSHAVADAPAAGSFTRELFEPKAGALGVSVEQWLQGAAQGTMVRRLPTLSQVAETAAFVASGHAGAMTGAIVNLTGGVIAD